jgi:hypothetical protein
MDESNLANCGGWLRRFARRSASSPTKTLTVLWRRGGFADVLDVIEAV